MFVTRYCRLLKWTFRAFRPLLIIFVSVVFFTALFFSHKNPRAAVTMVNSKTLSDPTRLKFQSVINDLNTGDLPALYAERRSRLYSACAATNGSGNTENILVYRNMSYGVVAKAGCTFWIRVFRFLHNDTNGHVLDNPFQMSRTEAHGGKRTIKMYRLQKAEDRKVVMSTTRFMVARNPFTRLYSAYMDKLFLPDMWHGAGRTIASRRHNASAQSQTCGHDVTFSEFLSYIADVGKVNPVSLNGHWRPIEHTCNPCTFRPDIVATQETFSKDSRFIMEKFGLGRLVQNHSHVKHVLDEMTILTDWNFGSGSKCLNRMGLAQRLWRTFQVNGYLTPGSESVLDWEHEATLTKDRLKYLVTKSYKLSPLSKQASGRQRNNYLKEAYRRVPRSVLEMIVRIYRNDFVYFGYNSSIKDLLH